MDLWAPVIIVILVLSGSWLFVEAVVHAVRLFERRCRAKQPTEKG